MHKQIQTYNSTYMNRILVIEVIKRSTICNCRTRDQWSIEQKNMVVEEKRADSSAWLLRLQCLCEICTEGRSCLRLGTLVDERLNLRVRSYELVVLLDRREAREPFGAIERLDVVCRVPNPEANSEERDVSNSDLLTYNQAHVEQKG